MNILFVTIDGDPLYVGGTATIVQLMAGWLQEQGHLCAIGYFVKGNPPTTFFKERIFCSQENKVEMKEFNEKHPFDILYITHCIGIDWQLLRDTFPNSHMIAAYHNRPMFIYPTKEELKYSIINKKQSFEKIILSVFYYFYPMFRKHCENQQRKGFRTLVNGADTIQLLSESFLPVFRQIIPDVDDNKFIFIGNPITKVNIDTDNLIENKEKTVLAVCNANFQKRAHLMIDVWKEIEKDPCMDEWRFIFVGDSEEVQRLKKVAIDDYKLKHIRFEGRRIPDAYYKKASILLMTSRYEGWPMVLTECMQYGVVPIVFNSFESLKDIITDHINGLIIPDNHMNQYILQLKWLMLNDEERNKMGGNALQIKDKYSIAKIMKTYEKLFERLTNKK